MEQRDRCENLFISAGDDTSRGIISYKSDIMS